jgi:hypothetical protein
MPRAASTPLLSWLKLTSTSPLSAVMRSCPAPAVAETFAMPSRSARSASSVVSSPFNPSRSTCTSVLVVRPVALLVTCTTKLPLLALKSRPLSSWFSATVVSSTTFDAVTLE